LVLRVTVLGDGHSALNRGEGKYAVKVYDVTLLRVPNIYIKGIYSVSKVRFSEMVSMVSLHLVFT
jgi:hypothetical protein